MASPHSPPREGLNQDLIERFEVLDTKISDDFTEHTTHRQNQKYTEKWCYEGDLGKGSFGTVRLEQNQSDGRLRAVKYIRRDDKELYKTEIIALVKFSAHSQYFAEFYGWYSDGDKIFLASEYFRLGDLRRCMLYPLPERQTASIAEQLLNGLTILHGENFIHRDIKPQNIFVVSNAPTWQVKIGDFGCSRRLENEDSIATTFTGTIAYQAPEFHQILDYCDDTGSHTNAVDLWSLGCILYELLTHLKPFGGEVRRLARYCRKSIEFPSKPLELQKVSLEGSGLIQVLLDPSPSQRGSAESALNSAWIKKFPSKTWLFGNSSAHTVAKDVTFTEYARRDVRIDHDLLHVHGQDTPSNRPLEERPSPRSDAQALSSVFTVRALSDDQKEKDQKEKDQKEKDQKEKDQKEKDQSSELVSVAGSPSIRDFASQRPELPLNNRIPLATVQPDQLDDLKPHDISELPQFGTPSVSMLTDIPPTSSSSTEEHKRLLEDLRTKWVEWVEMDPSDKLQRAAEDGDDVVVTMLLFRGANIEGEDRRGYKALHAAALSGQEAIIKLLLDRGADIQAENRKGFTPLHLAAGSGQEAIVKLLLDRRANIEAESRVGYTPLHSAAGSGQEAIVKLLLDRRANIEAEKREGATPLHVAARYGQEAIVKLLLDRRANIEAESRVGYTPLHVAAFSGQEAIARLLLNGGADPEAKNQKGETALHLAVNFGKDAITELLLNNRANIEAKDGQGKTALSIAVAYQAQPTVKLLIGRGAKVPAVLKKGLRKMFPTKQQQKELGLK